jgi:hypothetical protein
MHKRYFTTGELATARRLRAQGLPFKLIGQRLDRSPETLSNTLRHPPKTPADVRAKRREGVVEAFVAGSTLGDLAVALGITKPGVIKILETAGMDREMRELSRAELRRAA